MTNVSKRVTNRHLSFLLIPSIPSSFSSSLSLFCTFISIFFFFIIFIFFAVDGRRAAARPAFCEDVRPGFLMIQIPMQVAIVSSVEKGALAAAAAADGLANGGVPRLRSSFGRRRVAAAEEEEMRSSTESSSIGAPGSSSSPESSFAGDEGDGGDEEEVQSKPAGGGGAGSGPFGSLQALEDSLPIKRGLSSYFNGKSKSFACLTEISSSSTAEEIAKPENPFNKRRRILMACKSCWARRASCSSLAAAAAAVFPPLLSPDFAVVEEGDDGADESGGAFRQPPPPLDESSTTKLIAFKSANRSFSLSDLKQAN